MIRWRFSLSDRDPPVTPEQWRASEDGGPWRPAPSAGPGPTGASPSGSRGREPAADDASHLLGLFCGLKTKMNNYEKKKKTFDFKDNSRMRLHAFRIVYV